MEWLNTIGNLTHFTHTSLPLSLFPHTPLFITIPAHPRYSTVIFFLLHHFPAPLSPIYLLFNPHCYILLRSSIPYYIHTGLSWYKRVHLICSVYANSIHCSLVQFCCLVFNVCFLFSVSQFAFEEHPARIKTSSPLYHLTPWAVMLASNTARLFSNLDGKLYRFCILLSVM